MLAIIMISSSSYNLSNCECIGEKRLLEGMSAPSCFLITMSAIIRIKKGLEFGWVTSDRRGLGKEIFPGEEELSSLSDPRFLAQP